MHNFIRKLAWSDQETYGAQPMEVWDSTKFLANKLTTSEWIVTREYEASNHAGKQTSLTDVCSADRRATERYQTTARVSFSHLQADMQPEAGREHGR